MENGEMRKPFWTYLACCVAVFMISMDNLIVTNALPVIRQALHTGLEGLSYGALVPPFLIAGAGLGFFFFSAAGGLGSPAAFTAGLTAALSVSAAILAVSALVILLAPEIRPAGAACGRRHQCQR
jgi:MFS family permease